MTNVLTVARYDFRHVRRSKLLWGVVAIYVGFLGLVFYANAGTMTQTEVLFGATFLTTLLLPLVAIAASYLAVAGERESNTIRFLLGQPTSRRAVVLAKFLSRGLALVLALAVAFAVSVGIIVTSYPALEPDSLVPFLWLTTLVVLAYAAISVGVSAAVATRARAVAVTVGIYFVTVVLSVFQGVSIEAALRRLLGDVLGLSIEPDVYALAASVLSPAEAYLNAMLPVFGAAGPGIVPEDPPVFLQSGFLAGVLVLWIVVPLLFGVLVFGRSEIG